MQPLPQRAKRIISAMIMSQTTSFWKSSQKQFIFMSFLFISFWGSEISLSNIIICEREKCVKGERVGESAVRGIGVAIFLSAKVGLYLPSLERRWLPKLKMDFYLLYFR